MKRPIVLAALVSAIGATQVHADEYVDFGLLSLLNEQPLSIAFVIEILDIVGPDLAEPIDINSLNITFSAADDFIEPQSL
jgi:hypothetical protein